MASTSAGDYAALGALPPDLIGRCLSLLDPNERALYGRLVSKDACRRLSDPLHRTAAFSIPLPPEAAQPAWQQHIQLAFHQEVFRSKLLSLSAAAASGSQLNLELAWAMLQPCVALRSDDDRPYPEDAGTAAIRHGHLHRLPWLLQHGCPLNSERMVLAAAKHCDLAGMQRVWELLGGNCRRSDDLAIAIGGSQLDALGKLVWLLPILQDVYGDPQRVSQEALESAAAGAAASGNLPVLQWLLQRGMNLRARWAPFGPNDGASWWRVLSGALQNGHVVAADWLVDEAGCPVPHQAQPGEMQQQWELQHQQSRLQKLWDAAAMGGSVEAMRWLLGRGVPVFPGVVSHAARSGRLEAVQFLHEECGVELNEWVFCEAVRSGSAPLATWLLQAGCPMSKHAYGSAARGGQLAMVTWLVTEVKYPWGADTLKSVMESWRSRADSDSVGAGSSRNLERVVWALLEAGCPPGDGTLRGDSVGEAAACGFLPLVRHLHEERGVPFARGTLAAAARGGCVPVVEWLVGAGCRAGGPAVDGWEMNNPYVAAGASGGLGDVDTLSCLRRLGVPWHPRVMRWAVQYDPVPLRVLRWMVEQGAPWDGDALYSTIYDCLQCGMEDDDTVMWFAERLGL